VGRGIRANRVSAIIVSVSVEQFCEDDDVADWGVEVGTQGRRAGCKWRLEPWLAPPAPTFTNHTSSA